MRAIFFFVALILSLPAPAKHFRWASQGDAASLDPHAQNENVTNQVNGMVYEPALAATARSMGSIQWNVAMR